MMSKFYRECFCSLLDVRPHPVTSRIEWKRHRDVREQDRVAELFAERSPSPEVETDPIVYTEDDMEYVEDQMEYIEDEDQDSEGDTVMEDDLEVMEDELELVEDVLELVEDQVEYYHDILENLSGPHNDTSRDNDAQQALSGDEGDDERDDGDRARDELGDNREELEDCISQVETQTNQPGDGEEIIAEFQYQDELISDAESEESYRPPSEGVGQMQRGFVSPVEDELDIGSEPSSSDSSSSDTDAEDNAFPYGQIKGALKEEEILSVAIHDLKLSHRISRAASTDFTRLIENFTDASCWDY